MTQDEIIEMALVVGTIEDGDFFVFKHHELEAFAKLVAAKAAAKEREACAKIISSKKYFHIPKKNQLWLLLLEISDDIRARGKA